MKNKYILLIIIIILGVAIAGYLWINSLADKINDEPGEEVCQDCSVESFEDCIANGNAIMESYPRQCRTADGRTFTENIGNELEKMDLIRIDYPRPNQEIENPLIVQGEARGYWFFEASFPIVLTDWDGLIIAQGIAQAKEEWMTEDFVQFEAVLEFEKPEYGNKGNLILQKDNPSGLPENEDALEIPINFK